MTTTEENCKESQDHNRYENADTLQFSEVVKAKPKEKLPSTWGKLNTTTSLKGAIADIFLHNCDIDVTEDDIRAHFQSQSVNLRNIEKLSHRDSSWSSFKVSPPSQDSFDRIISGELLPIGIAARKFIPRRRNRENKPMGNGRANEFYLSGSSNSQVTVSKLNEALAQLDKITPGNMDCSNPS